MSRKPAFRELSKRPRRGGSRGGGRNSAPRRRAVIRGAHQIRRVTNPVRQEILDVLSRVAPLPIGEIAAILGRRPTSLYYHVRALVDAGLIIERGVRAKARTHERLYSARPMRVRYDLASRAGRDALNVLSASMHRVARRDFERGLTDPAARASGLARNLWTLRAVARLSQDELRRLNRLLEEILNLFVEHERRQEGSWVSLSWSLAPLGGRGRPKA